MKAKERHHLKENEFAATTARLVSSFNENRDRIKLVAIVAVVLGVAAGGYWFWQKSTNDRAGALLGIAMATAQAPVVPPPTVPGAQQAPGTYPDDKARLEAAIKAFQDVDANYPSTTAGVAARYHVGTSLVGLGRFAEAEQAFRDVIDRAGSSIYGPAARLGLGEAQLAAGKTDEAIKVFTDLAADRDGALPVDGVLMQLARACVKAGKTAEARAAFKRVVDEFPESPYVADARKQLAAM